MGHEEELRKDAQRKAQRERMEKEMQVKGKDELSSMSPSEVRDQIVLNELRAYQIRARLQGAGLIIAWALPMMALVAWGYNTQNSSLRIAAAWALVIGEIMIIIIDAVQYWKKLGEFHDRYFAK